MTLSLEVLPRMMDPGERLSATHVTKVGLYDHFIEHWLEREKKRLGGKTLSPQSESSIRESDRRRIHSEWDRFLEETGSGSVQGTRWPTDCRILALQG